MLDSVMKTAVDHYDDLYGDLGLLPQDAAKWVFASGWNSAMSEMLAQVKAMPLERDTKASFQVFIQNMMHVDPDTITKVTQ
jgi:hypothetical protein